jgi:ABC-type oligopeptide transport system substrate-binding subunit
MKRFVIALPLIALWFATAALAQNASKKEKEKSSDTNEQKEVITQEPAPSEPWYANSQGAYTVSLGTGQLISLYPQVRNDQTIPNGEYVEGQQSVSLKSKDYRYQMFYGLSASSVYTNSIGGVNVNQDLLSTSVSPYVALFMPTRTGRFLLL